MRTCGWSYSGNQFFYSTDKAMGQKSELRVYELDDVKARGASAEPVLVIPSHESKITSAIWGPVDETIITGHENGGIIKWNAKVSAPFPPPLGNVRNAVRPARVRQQHRLPVWPVRVRRGRMLT